MIKVSIGVPSNRLIQPKTAECLMTLVAHGGYEFHFVVASEGYTVAENRNYIAVKALNYKSDYLLFIDDDMTFPHDLLDSLIAVDKDIVGVAYHPRSETGKIIKFLDETHTVRLEETDDPKYKVPFKCHATGTGIVLIKTYIFMKVPRPWFDFIFNENGSCAKGEDWYFCEKAAKSGFEIW